MTKKHKNMAISNIINTLKNHPLKMPRNLLYGGISADFNFMPEDILVWQLGENLDVSNTSVHQRMILKIILKGSCTMIVDGLRIHMKAGDMICIFPMQFHTTILECKREEYSFLAISFVEKSRNYSSFTSLKNRLLTPDKEDINNITNLILNANLLGSSYPEKSIFPLLNILLNQKRKLQDKQEKIKNNSDLFDKICDYIRNNFEKDISLKTLAAEFSITPETVRRQFRKAEIGLTPGKLISRLRFQLATELLQNTNYSITEIGYRCGYKDPFTFSRAFRKAVGKSPSFYRK